MFGTSKQRLCQLVWPALALGLGMSLWTWAAPRASADTIDDELHRHAGTIQNWLERQGYKNVGVLKFKTQLGDAPESYFAGRLNSVMANRLENVLILANIDEHHPIGITHDASSVASAKDKSANYDTAKDRKKLFDHDYPLAWGSQKVKVDALVTGLVRLSNNYKFTTVTVQSFTPADLEPVTICAFTVPTNRALVTDMNKDFFISRRELNKTLKLPKDFDKRKDKKELAEKVQYGLYQDIDRKTVVTAGWGVGTKPVSGESLDDLLEIKIFYYSKSAKPTEVVRNNKNEVQSPRKDENVFFSLRVKKQKEDNRRVGVVFRVNGINTSSGEFEGRDVDQQAMWVLEPGVEYQIPGFYDGKELRKFVGLSEEASEAYYLMDESKRGKIEVDVFQQIDIPEPAFKLPEIKAGSTYRRGITGAKTLEDAVAGIRKAGTPPSTRRGLIAPAKEGVPILVNQVPFDNVVHSGHLTITYYKK